MPAGGSRDGDTSSRQLARWELEDVGGAVVVVDVIRAFTTAAYAFGAGARRIFFRTLEVHSRAAWAATIVFFMETTLPQEKGAGIGQHPTPAPDL